MNSWETCALEYRFAKSDDAEIQVAQCTTTSDTVDPLIYPGLYCPSGVDIMNVLFRIYSRPNPQINLGPIDCSVSLLVCDLALPDNPVIYASDAFLQMTGYRMDEIKGRNCRFLQAPGGQVRARSARKYVDSRIVRAMHDAITTNTEHQAQVINFKKNGTPFVNTLTIIPIHWDTPEYRYSVGFLCEKT